VMLPVIGIKLKQLLKPTLSIENDA
jgi:hypothetical protein